MKQAAEVNTFVTQAFYMIFPNLEEVKHTLVVLFPLGETIELRCVGHHHTIGGYYHDQQKLAEDACTLNLDLEPKENVFVCLNPN